MKALVLALQLMTRLPLPDVQASGEDMARSIRWFPVAGLAVGGCVALAGWAGLALSLNAQVGALLGLLAWVGVTGALHLDGLGDIADGAGAAHKGRERLSAVLADPHIGSFGVTVLVLQLLAKFVLLAAFLALAPVAVVPWLALVLIPFAARIAPLGWALWLPPLHEGMGSRFGGGASGVALAIWLVLLAACAALFAPGLLVAVPAAVLWAFWLRSRIGGISGDGHGAGIELVETATLAALVLFR